MSSSNNGRISSPNPSSTMPALNSNLDLVDMTREEQLEEPVPLQDSTVIDVDEDDFFLKAEGESFQHIVAMSIGLENGIGGRFGESMNIEDDSRFPSTSSGTDGKKKKKKKGSKQTKWKPNVSGLAEEIKRRKKAYYTNIKGRSEMTKKKAMEWLLEHPITDASHIAFVKAKMNAFFEATKAVEEEKENAKRD